VAEELETVACLREQHLAGTSNDRRTWDTLGGSATVATRVRAWSKVQLRKEEARKKREGRVRGRET
jgi:hypothetical protein